MRAAAAAAAEYFSLLFRCHCCRSLHRGHRFLSTLPPPPPPPQEEENQEEKEKKERENEEYSPPRDPSEVFLRWGCSHSDLSSLRSLHPSLLRMSPSSLSQKLSLLRSLGLLLTPSDLLRVVKTRPRLLHRRLPSIPELTSRLTFLSSLFFPSQPLLLRSAILRNPSLLLSYPVPTSLLPCTELYASLGVPPADLARLLLARPTIVPRSVLSPDKLRLLNLTPLPPSSPLSKYAVSIVLISRADTLRAKISNLERFGFSNEDVMSLFARSPNVLTLSVDKVNRNMTYVTGIMRLPASSVLRAPMLLQVNLEGVLKARYLVGVKLKEMGLLGTGMLDGEKEMVKAMRMKEARFLKVFVTCHGAEVAEELTEYYNGVKGSKRLAESARKATRKGFPF